MLKTLKVVGITVQPSPGHLFEVKLENVCHSLSAEYSHLYI